MKRYIALALILLSGTVSAQQSTTRFFVAYDYEAVTVAASSIGFTASKIVPTGAPYNAQMVAVKIECAVSSPCDTRFTVDGTTPTSSVGTLLSDGASFVIYGYANIRDFRAIRTGANSASYRVNYYR